MVVAATQRVMQSIVLILGMVDVVRGAAGGAASAAGARVPVTQPRLPRISRPWHQHRRQSCLLVALASNLRQDRGLKQWRRILHSAFCSSVTLVPGVITGCFATSVGPPPLLVSRPLALASAPSWSASGPTDDSPLAATDSAEPFSPGGMSALMRQTAAVLLGAFLPAGAGIVDVATAPHHAGGGGGSCAVVGRCGGVAVFQTSGYCGCSTCGKSSSRRSRRGSE